MKNIENGLIKAIIINSGNANACVGNVGDENAKEVAVNLAAGLNCKPNEIAFGSTGVIGFPLNMDCIRSGINKGIEELSEKGSIDAATAILTTDLVVKESAVRVENNKGMFTIGAMAKGSGMIHPNMATMIGVITSDVNISKDLLHKALVKACNKSFNRILVDGDTSVCDMVVLLANGNADYPSIKEDSEDYKLFVEGLGYVCTELSKKVVSDGEGATKLIEIYTKGANKHEDAVLINNSVAKSPLVKTAFFGEDANWGRILTAVGYSGVVFDPDKIDIYIADLCVCKDGKAIKFDEEYAKSILMNKEIKVVIDLKTGSYDDTVWTCDLSYDYIKINGSYRT